MALCCAGMLQGSSQRHPPITHPRQRPSRQRARAAAATAAAAARPPAAVGAALRRAAGWRATGCVPLVPRAVWSPRPRQHSSPTWLLRCTGRGLQRCSGALAKCQSQCRRVGERREVDWVGSHPAWPADVHKHVCARLNEFGLARPALSELTIIVLIAAVGCRV